MDPRRRALLIEAIQRQGLPNPRTPLPVVVLEAFFEGNDDPGSIGCNLEPHPGVDAFYRILREIRARPDVQDVFVEVSEVMETDESTWPFSERIFLLTSAPQSEVELWLTPLQPDDVGEGYPLGMPTAAPPLGPGMHVYSAWWD